MSLVPAAWELMHCPWIHTHALFPRKFQLLSVSRGTCGTVHMIVRYRRDVNLRLPMALIYSGSARRSWHGATSHRGSIQRGSCRCAMAIGRQRGGRSKSKRMRSPGVFSFPTTRPRWSSSGCFLPEKSRSLSSERGDAQITSASAFPIVSKARRQIQCELPLATEKSIRAELRSSGGHLDSSSLATALVKEELKLQERTNDRAHNLRLGREKNPRI